MWQEILRALALVLIIEGLLPFIAPDRWRAMLLQVIKVDSRSLRIFGAVMIGSGIIALQLLRV
jgi:uncharacterized protein YjeT (DUF2065 family)